jgi:hypothetical protein
LTLTACAARKPAQPLSADGVKARHGHYVGNPLAGAQPVPQPFIQQDALAVHIRVIGIEQAIRPDLAPLAAHARLLATIEGDNPFLATPSVTQPARYGMGVEAERFAREISAGARGRTIELANFHGVICAGVTAYQELATGTQAAGNAHRLRLALYRPAATPAGTTTQPSPPPVQLALLVQNPPAPAPQPAAPRPADSTGDSEKRAIARRRAAEAPPTRETALISQPVDAAGQSIVLLMPFTAPGTQIQSIAFVIELSLPSADRTFEDASAAMSSDIQTAATEAATRLVTPPPGALDRTFVTSVIDAITYGNNRRAAVVYLAGQTDARFAGQTAMAADDDFLSQLSLSIVDGIGRQDLWTPQQAGWLLDRSSFELLARTAIKRRLSPELSGVLITLAGEAGRSPAAMEQILANLSTRQDFENRLIAENFIALEDTSPAARVRAFDWLKAHDRQPAGYDPLGEASQRSAAIEKAVDEMNQSGVQQ